MLLCVIMVYGILGDFNIVTVVCCCASLWGIVYWGFCVLCLCGAVVRRYGVLYIGDLCTESVVCCFALV